MELKENLKLKGKITIIEKTKDGRISFFHTQENLIVENQSERLGISAVVRAFIDDAFSIKISQVELGTGQTAPTKADVGLDSPLNPKVIINRTAIDQITPTGATVSFYSPGQGTVKLGDYWEVGVFVIGEQGDEPKLFSRIVLDRKYEKSENTDTTVLYQIILNT